MQHSHFLSVITQQRVELLFDQTSCCVCLITIIRAPIRTLEWKDLCENKGYVWRQNKDYEGGAACWSSNSLLVLHVYILCCIYLNHFSDLSLSVVYFEQLFVYWVVVYSDQLLGARNTLLYLITITRLLCLVEKLDTLIKRRFDWKPSTFIRLCTT